MTTTEIEQILASAEIIYTMDMDAIFERIKTFTQRWE